MTTAMQKENKKTFWKKIKFKYKVLIVNSNTLEEVARLSISKLNGFSLVLFSALFIFLLASIIIIFTPLRNYLPGYVNSEVRSQIVTNKVYADSIADELAKQAAYIDNLKSILNGEAAADTVAAATAVTTGTKDTLPGPTQRELAFRQAYEDNEKYNLTSTMISQSRLNGLAFSRPIAGMVTTQFNPAKGNNGIDISTEASLNICALLDGTVVFTSYAAGRGYTAVVQHSNNLTSIYSGCATLLKSTGQTVKAGEAIAVTDDKPGDNLHLEVWHNGKPLDPNKYIAF